MKREWTKPEIKFVQKQYKNGHSRTSIAKLFKAHYGYDRTPNSIKHIIDTYCSEVEVDIDPPKVLIVDLETAPIEGNVWGFYDQNLSPEMVIENSYVLAWGAKWLGSPENEVMYMDQRHKKGKSKVNDKQLIKKLLKLMEEADVVLGQNSVAFDVPVINERTLEHGLPEVIDFKQLDTKKIAKSSIRLPSYSLEYMSKRFNKKYIKSDHPEFSGFRLWNECKKDNVKAFQSMEKYCKFDILATEELFTHLSRFCKKPLVREAMRAYNKAKESTSKKR